MGALAQNSPRYLQSGITTVAIVAQQSTAVQDWLADHPLPFRLLVDESRDTLRAYGVWHRIGLDAWNISRPALFLVRQDRSIARSFVASNQREFVEHEEILRWIRDIGQGSGVRLQGSENPVHEDPEP